MDVTSEVNSNIIEATVHGKITKSDMEKVDELLKEKTAKQEPINLLVVIEDMKGITLKGLLEDMKMATYLRSIKKAAIVGDRTWLKVDAKIENLLPGVEVKHFEVEEKSNAVR